MTREILHAIVLNLPLGLVALLGIQSDVPRQLCLNSTQDHDLKQPNKPMHAGCSMSAYCCAH